MNKYKKPYLSNGDLTQAVMIVLEKEDVMGARQTLPECELLITDFVITQDEINEAHVIIYKNENFTKIFKSR